MAEKEKKETKAEPKKKRLHLHEIRSTQAHDGSIVHHHRYAEDKESEPGPERGPMATSGTPDEAGQHVAEQFAMNQGGGGAPGAAPGGAEPGAEEAQGAPPPDAGGGGGGMLG